MAVKKHHHSFIDDEFNLPHTEEKVLEFWKTNDVFAKSLKQHEAGGQKLGVAKDNGRASRVSRRASRPFVFYEGPPTANGKPGLHHVIARAFKDIIPRFKTMQGFYVPRKGGWDTHGLPVEIEVEKALGLKSKKEIDQYGIAAFNARCRESVWKYKEMWEKMTERMGFWIDMKDPYVTYENNYIESLWWIISQIAKKKLLYKSYKIVPWCTRCGTGLSSHEIGQPGAYKTVEDESVYVRFKIKNPAGAKALAGRQKTKIKNEEPTYILSWTTTPWTLPGNVALAVGEKIIYAVVRKEGVPGLYMLAKDLVSTIFKDEKVEVVHADMKGKDLVGLAYEPLFDIKALQNEKSYKIYAANFVTTTDGTGVVHTAVMYGEDDYALGKKLGLPQHHTVDETGKFTKDVAGFEGQYVKSKETEKKIFEHLEKKGYLFKTEVYSHEYPHCWRCSTPLLYYARSAWFVAMSKLQGELLENNNKIHWVPEHIKTGRFGEWLREVKDWNFSRERYWGTPLPVWECKDCGHTQVIGSIAELKKYSIGRNNYVFLRHGESDNVVDNITGPHKDTPEYTSRLTVRGRKKVEKTAMELKATKGKIDLIIASPLARTRETARIVSKVIGAPVSYDKNLIDINAGIFYLKKVTEYWKFFKNREETFTKPLPGGESRNDIKRRVVGAWKEIDRANESKNILIVSHGDPLLMLKGSLEGLSNKQMLEGPYPQPGELYAVDANPLPLDESGNLDVHRPFIDEITLTCLECRASRDPAKRDKKSGMRRVKEICDVWYDSGAMPFAQAHWPFGQTQTDAKRNAVQRGKLAPRASHPAPPALFPADYISEAIDQTRGWFYTLLAVSTLLGFGEPYKNVICLGLLNDKNGRKMSKSVGNVIDPWELMNRHGIDAVRWYLYTMNPPGDPKNFDEQELAKTFRRVHLILYNSALFWKTYGQKSKIKNQKSKSDNILDAWILARLDETILNATDSLEKYEVREGALEIERFIDDLSRWYIRRSRRRLQKSEDKKDYESASATLHIALLQTTKLMAPFNPFFAEGVYRMLGGEELSVHLDSWPEVKSKIKNQKSKLLISQMETLRKIASDALAKRAEAGIKVRQPLASLKIKNQKSKIKIAKELLDILKDEINVKKVVYDAKLKELFVLDTVITPELRVEGIVRDFIRTVSELRAKANFKPTDKIFLFADFPDELEALIFGNEKNILKETNSRSIAYKRTDKFTAEIETKLGEYQMWLAVRKM